jgi:DNA-binding response OmpR family regulator
MLDTIPSFLITDDDRDFRETVRSVFEPWGVRTFMAANGEEALDIVYNQRVDLVLLDFHMPRLDGLETLRRVKAHRAVTPCIIISAGLQTGAIEPSVLAGLQARAFSVLAKPVSCRELTTTVEDALWQTYGWRR